MKKRINVKYVERLQSGDMNALSKIYEFYKAPLYYFALSIVKNTIDAEEVIQEVFFKVQKNISQLKSAESFHTWLFSITYNESLRKQQSKTRNIEVDDNYNIEEHVMSKENQKVDLDNSTLMNEIHSAFQRLSKKNKITAELRFICGLSLKEIATELDIPVGVVKSRIFTIRKLVSKDLEKRGYSPRKYFSFVGIPLLYQLMSNEYKKQSKRLLIYHTKDTLLPILKGFLISSIILTTVIIFNIYQTPDYKSTQESSQQEQIIKKVFRTDYYINQIIYNQNPSKYPLEIKVKLIDEISDEQIVISFENEEIDFENIGDTVIFTAEVNGRYLIQVKDEQQIIFIHNIDSDIPSILEAEVYKDCIVFIVDDYYERIDYTASYIIYDDRYINFPETLQIDGNYSGELVVVLIDTYGSKEQYIFNLPKEKEEESKN